MAFASDKVRQGAAGVSTGGYSIDNSLRFNDDDSPRLNRTPSTTGDTTEWTFSCWFKRGNSVTETILSANTDSNNKDSFYFASDLLYFYQTRGGSHPVALVTSAKFRDYSAWYHLVLSVDTALTSGNRHKLYVNGEQVTFTGTDGNNTTYINSNVKHAISTSTWSDTLPLDGYLSEVHFIDGQALDPTSFGETGDYGEWKPIAVTGMTYGTNGFYLDFSNSGSLGTDASSNTNNWTVNNLAATDQMLDTPTNNFCTNLSFITKFHSSYPTIVHSEGNLKVEFSWAAGGNNGAVSSVAIPSTGKWYMERCILTTGNGYGYPGDGISDLKGLPDSPDNTRQVYNHGGTINSDGDIYGVGYDADAGTLYNYKNGSQVNSESLNAGLVGKQLHFLVKDDQSSGNKKMPFITNYGQDSSFAGKKTAQGNADDNGIGDFYYAPPTGFLALCTQNLPEPTVVPSEHFNTVTYTGTGTASRSITGVGFQPDFTWIKNRGLGNHHQLHDNVRGATTGKLSSNSTATEDSSYPLTSFDTDGYTTKSGAQDGTNNSGYTFVAWNWKAGGTGASNTNGTITSTVSANADAGFSIVSWTGTGVDNSTIGHGLSKAPEMIITKKTNQSDSWNTFHKDLTSGNEIFLDLTSAQSNDSNNASWGDNHPASVGASTFAVGYAGDMNGSDVEMIAYCFHSVDGYSKVGSHTGNGSTDGTFVYTGFRPAYVMVKRTDSSNVWGVMDTDRTQANYQNFHLIEANSSATEDTGADYVDMVSNGFKVRASSLFINASGGSYIYLAFAENPFKYTNAR